MSASAFGRATVRDPSLVRDLRRGRALRPPTEARLVAWLDTKGKRREGGRCRRR